jgi:hypothetical protein
MEIITFAQLAGSQAQERRAAARRAETRVRAGAGTRAARRPRR